MGNVNVQNIIGGEKSGEYSKKSSDVERSLDALM